MKNKWISGLCMVLLFALMLAACDNLFEEDSWVPDRRALSPPWDTYLVGEKTTNTSGSVYGSGSSTDTFDGTNVFISDSYQYWKGGSKYRKSTCYIVRIELHQESWESYPVWRIFYKLESPLWHSESDFNESLELAMRVPTVLSGKHLEDFEKLAK
jgi:hypothetical protein